MSVAGFPSAKKRFPVPTGPGRQPAELRPQRVFERIDVNVELPQRIRSGPSCDLIRRMPSTMSGSNSFERAPFKSLRMMGRDIFLLPH